MKRIKKLLPLLFSVLFVLIAGLTASARAEEYYYTVTVSPGNNGTVSGDESETFVYGQQWNPNDYTVNVSDPKYYFKGFHISGQEGVVGATRITKDTVFVATYGIAGNTVKYFVNYHDENGNELIDSQVYYGNVGDKPVVAYLYIENYQPQAYNLTRTLQENEAENVFTFTYTPIAAGGNNNDSGGGSGGGGENGSGGGSNPQDGSGGAGGSGGSGAGQEGEGTVIIDENDTPAGAPEDLIDLDDNETPLAEDDVDGSGSGSDRSKTVVRIAEFAGGACAVIGASLFIYWLIARKRRRRDDEEQQ